MKQAFLNVGHIFYPLKPLVLIGISLLLFVIILFPAPTNASPQSEACEAIGGELTIASGKCVTPGTSVNKAIKAVVTTLSVLVGIVSVVMVIVGGFKYVTSGGDANAAKSARSTITYALVGVVVAALAQPIVFYVLSKVK